MGESQDDKMREAFDYNAMDSGELLSTCGTDALAAAYMAREFGVEYTKETLVTAHAIASPHYEYLHEGVT